jgi:GT2 family glycosyltransferase
VNPKASIIISNYQGRELLPKCLKYLMDQTYDNFEVILVDAGSADGSADYVSANFPSVILLRRGRIGIGEAVNVGIHASTGEIIVFDFNTDEFVDPDWLEQIVKQLEKYHFKVITGTTRLIYGTDLIDECGVNLGFLGQARKKGHKRPKTEFLLKDEPTLYVGCPAFHRDILKMVGPVDENYFLYGEDLDFCFRAKLMGIETRPAPLALSHHKIRTTYGKSLRRLEFFLRRAYLRFHTAFSSPPQFLINILYLLIFLQLPALIGALCPIEKSVVYREKLVGRTMALIWYAKTLKQHLERRKQFKKVKHRLRESLA